jgi:predicted DsbA family dithiol-disulfide isomerase
VVGLGGLEAALDKLKAEGITAEVHFQPFELNPQMPPEGENIVEHIGRKYGSTPEQSAANRAMITERAAEAWPGFGMRMGPDSRIWNTFDAHRLLHWAEKAGNAHALKMALFDAHFSRGQPLNDPETLIAAARAAGLDADAARDVLDSGRYAEDVRANQRWWREEQDITAVPAIIFNGKYAIMGGQPPATFEKVIRRIVAGEI